MKPCACAYLLRCVNDFQIKLRLKTRTTSHTRNSDKPKRITECNSNKQSQFAQSNHAITEFISQLGSSEEKKLADTAVVVVVVCSCSYASFLSFFVSVIFVL